MAFADIIGLRPIKIEELQKKLQKQREIEARQLALSKKITKRIQENPIKRNKFQID